VHRHEQFLYARYRAGFAARGGWTTERGLYTPGRHTLRGNQARPVPSMAYPRRHSCAAWADVADGTRASGPSVTHTFEPGTYDVTFVTIDNQGATGFGYADRILHVGNLRTGATMYSGPSLQVTKDVNMRGQYAEVVIAGDPARNSNGHIGGDVVAAGNVHLTNNGHIDGSLRAWGTVSMDSTSKVSGDGSATDAVRFQSTARIGGSVTTGLIFTVIDGVAVQTLIAKSLLGGPVATRAVVNKPDPSRPPRPSRSQTNRSTHP
jgi:cytoskeletal protein CcmA (bactofilin family)